MSYNNKMTLAKLEITEKEADIDEALVFARDNMGGDAWLLAESPRKLVFRRWNGELDNQLKHELTSLTIFGPNSEARLEKSMGAARGWLRLLREGDAGEESLVRRGAALLREKGRGRLKYAEYFKPDESGFLIRRCWRLCGVEGE